MTDNPTVLDRDRAKHFQEINAMLPPERQRAYRRLLEATGDQVREKYPQLSRKDRRELARKMSRARSRVLKGAGCLN